MDRIIFCSLFDFDMDLWNILYLFLQHGKAY